MMTGIKIEVEVGVLVRINHLRVLMVNLEEVGAEVLLRIKLVLALIVESMIRDEQDRRYMIDDIIDESEKNVQMH